MSFPPRVFRRLFSWSDSSVVLIAALGIIAIAGCGRKPPVAASRPPIAKKAAPDQPQLAPVATKLRLRPIYRHALKTVAFNPKGDLLATGNGLGLVQIWSVANAQLQRTIPAHENWAFSVAFSPDGLLLASGGGDNLIKVWDAATGKLVHELAGHTDDVHGVVFLDASLNSGARLASGADDKTVRIWELASGTAQVLTGHERQVTAVAVSPDGKLLASASRDATVRLWNTKTGEHVRTLEGHKADVLDVAFSQDGAQLLTASYDKTARLWDVATGQQLHRFAGHEGWVFAAAISPGGESIATGGGDKKLRLWRRDGDQPEHVIDLGADIASLDYAHHGRLLAVALTDSTVRLFDTSGQTPRQISQLGEVLRGTSGRELQPPINFHAGHASPPREYLNLHHAAMTPGDDAWRTAVARLAVVGDGFTLQYLTRVDKSTLSPEDKKLLESTVEKIGERTANRNAAQVAAVIQTRFERAAVADLQCDPLESELKLWTLDSIRSHRDTPEIRKELERIRDHYESDQKLTYGSVILRVRSYAESLLAIPPPKVTR